MAERGITPQVSDNRRRTLRAVRALCRPLLPDDYLEMINPLWSTRELRGRIERIDQETPEAATILIRPGYEWGGHRPGQYLRIGVVVDGIHHWRAYSLTSDPERSDGCIAITPKLVESGKVSPYLVRHAKPGDLVRLGGVEGTFVLPDPAPEKLLFITAGSGITPIMGMLNGLHRNDALGDVVHLHSARRAEEVIFASRLRELSVAADGYDLRLRLTAVEGRLAPDDLDAQCPDWRQRHAFLSGPAAMLAEFGRHWDSEGDPGLLDLECFQPVVGGEPGGGEGGTIRFLKSGVEIDCDGATPVLLAGEQAGVPMPFGCRMGICQTCVSELRSGRLRDLRNGEIHGREREMVRTCVNAPEGPIEIVL
jgi:ferredoxin-NADP reductase